MSEATELQFRLICGNAGDCRARYCPERARYWAIWKRTLNTAVPTRTIKRAVCRNHWEAIQGKPWSEVSDEFGTAV
jgi:hypothetical protein